MPGAACPSLPDLPLQPLGSGTVVKRYPLNLVVPVPRTQAPSPESPGVLLEVGILPPPYPVPLLTHAHSSAEGVPSAPRCVVQHDVRYDVYCSSFLICTAALLRPSLPSLPPASPQSPPQPPLSSLPSANHRAPISILFTRPASSNPTLRP